MSFTWLRPEGPLRTREQIAREVHAVSLARGLDELATVIALMTISVEVGTGTGELRRWWCPANDRVPATKNYPHDSKSDDNRSSGYLQQQPGPNGEPWWGTPEDMMTLARAANTFLERLPDDYGRAKDNPALAGEFAQRVQGSSFPHRYQERWDEAWTVLRRALAGTPIPSLPPKSDQSQEAAVGSAMQNPFTDAVWSPNSSVRNTATPRWIGLHTQEGNGTARQLAAFLKNPASQVSYHSVNDDHEVLQIVDEARAPWAAASANFYAFHHCFAGSYAGWSRNKWLETDAGDGKNEDAELTKGAHVVAWWCQKYDIPAVWIGGRNVPPWGLDGVCGHKDFGAWGGGHHDPGANFPVDEFMRRVTSLLAGVDLPAMPTPEPVPAPGTRPGNYEGVLLYRGRALNDPEQVAKVQDKLRRKFASYAGHLAVDGDFGPMTEAAVREFQRRSGLIPDGIVGPMTAAALKPWQARMAA